MSDFFAIQESIDATKALAHLSTNELMKIILGNDQKAARQARLADRVRNAQILMNGTHQEAAMEAARHVSHLSQEQLKVATRAGFALDQP